MAGASITGSVGNTAVSVATSSALQAVFAQQILMLSASSASQLVTGSGGVIASGVVVDTSASSVLSGSPLVPTAQIVLAGQLGVYNTGGTTLSTVIAADNSNSSVVNSNPGGGLLAITGAGGNVLEGLAGVNQFVTGVGGQDIVVLGGVSNSLTTNGADAVLVTGPSTITAGASGIDNVSMTSGTTLAFINGSAAGVVDSVTGAANSTVLVAGSGSTSVMSGAGKETFVIDTSAGNVTLNGTLNPNVTFEFIKNAAHSTGNIVVSNFAGGDQVLALGYSGFNVTAAAGNASGSILTLSDGVQVSFNNLSVAALQQVVKTS